MAVNQNQGSKSFLQLIEILRDCCLDNKLINTVSQGDISEVDLDKQSIFPLAHIIVNNAQFSSTSYGDQITKLLQELDRQITIINSQVIGSTTNIDL